MRPRRRIALATMQRRSSFSRSMSIARTRTRGVSICWAFPLESSLALDPKHFKSWLNLSRVLLEQGRRDDALARVNQAIALDPESGVAYRVKGRVFDEMALEVQAVDAYRRAIEIDNTDAWSMNNMALIFIEEGLFDKALP